jgi:hypothetical protein
MGSGSIIFFERIGIGRAVPAIARRVFAVLIEAPVGRPMQPGTTQRERGRQR